MTDTAISSPDTTRIQIVNPRRTFGIQRRYPLYREILGSRIARSQTGTAVAKSVRQRFEWFIFRERFNPARASAFE